MKKIRVLVVDDSSVIRDIIAKSLKRESQIEVIGFADNGKRALEVIKQLNPDVVTLDIEMPEMDGLTALKEIRKLDKCIPVIMFSSLTHKDGDEAINAFAEGASDCVGKPDYSAGSIEAIRSVINTELIPKIFALVRDGNSYKKITHHRFTQKLTLEKSVTSGQLNNRPFVNNYKKNRHYQALCIGASTGGPMALMELFSGIKLPLQAPMFIVQHMPENFTEMLALRLTTVGGMSVKEACNNEVAIPGFAYIAPGGFHMTLSRVSNKIIINLNKDLPENNSRPAVDVLFRSAAKVFGQNLLAIVLTGMGSDGLKGCREIAENGGSIIAQDKKSSVVWGMPGAVVLEGLASKIMSIHEIAPEIINSLRAS